MLAALAASLVIISHRFPFVNTFLKVFLNFFFLFSVFDSFLLRDIPSLEGLVIIAHTSSFVKSFLRVFCIFFNICGKFTKR